MEPCSAIETIFQNDTFQALWETKKVEKRLKDGTLFNNWDFPRKLFFLSSMRDKQGRKKTQKWNFVQQLRLFSKTIL
jgi:hypothetical protein